MSEKELADVSTARRGNPGGPSAGVGLVPALTIVSHPLARRVGEQCRLDALLLGREVSVSRNAPDFSGPGGELGAPLGDPFLSRRPFTLAPVGPGRIQLRPAGAGTEVVVAQPVHGNIELGPETLANGVPIELAGRVVLLLHQVEAVQEKRPSALGMVGRSASLDRVRREIEQVADLDVPVLIRGETGTGKELVARAIHQESERRNARFISVNLGSLSKDLAAAELFGAVKGAYTGALHERRGFFQAAGGGTLFLDEVGEAPPEIQAMLLRVLETGELYPVGGHTPIAADVRVIAATDADLEAQIHNGRFKAPLLHRLAGYEIRLPPLRERREDIGLLFHHFAREELEQLGAADRLASEDPYAAPWLPAPLAARLVRGYWPGNIRQLRNLTRRVVIGSRGRPELQLDPWVAEELDRAAAIAPVTPAPVTPAPVTPATVAPSSEAAARRKPSEVTKEELLAALRESAWDLKAAAGRLNISRPSLYVLIDKCSDIRTAGDLSAEEITRCFHECGGDLDVMVGRLQVSRRALHRRIKELRLHRKPG